MQNNPNIVRLTEELSLLSIGELDQHEAERLVTLTALQVRTFSEAQELGQMVASGGYSIKSPWPTGHWSKMDLAYLYRTRREVLRYVAELILGEEQQARMRQAWREKQRAKLQPQPDLFQAIQDRPR